MSTTNSMKATEIIDALQQAKSDIKTALGDVKVTVIEQDYPEVTTAIRGFFGDIYVKDGVAVITFDMISECIRVVREAGKGKAQELLV